MSQIFCGFSATKETLRTKALWNECFRSFEPVSLMKFCEHFYLFLNHLTAGDSSPLNLLILLFPKNKFEN